MRTSTEALFMQTNHHSNLSHAESPRLREDTTPWGVGKRGGTLAANEKNQAHKLSSSAAGKRAPRRASPSSLPYSSATHVVHAPKDNNRPGRSTLRARVSSAGCAERGEEGEQCGGTFKAARSNKAHHRHQTRATQNSLPPPVLREGQRQKAVTR